MPSAKGKTAVLAVAVAAAGLVACAAPAFDVDVLVVGGTTRGIVAAKKAKAEGKRVFLATAHAFLGEDRAATLELAAPPGGLADAGLEDRLWTSGDGSARFDYWPERETPGLRWIFWNDWWDRLAEPGLPPSLQDGVLYADDISYRCVLRQPAKIAKAGVIVLEPKAWLSESILNEKEMSRLNRERNLSRRVATSAVFLEFLSGPRKGERIELKRRGPVREYPGVGWYDAGPAVLFEGDVDAEISEAKVTVCVDKTAHHQLVSRIRFLLEDPGSVRTPPTPLKVKRVYDRELQDAGVDFITATPVRRVFRGKDGKIDAIEFVNRSGRTLVRANEVVDATLYGFLGRVPAVSPTERFSRMVLSDGERPAAPGMTVEEQAGEFTAAHSDLHGRLYRCAFSLPMRDGTFPSFAEAEWQARELTKTGRLVDAADFLVWRGAETSQAMDIPSGSLPEWGSFDVIVVGGGTSGAAAGLAAARTGAKTLIVEYADVLGGTGTDGQVLGYFDGNQVGFMQEFEKATERHLKNHAQYVRAETWRELCREAGVTVWHGAMGLGAVRDGRRVVGVEVSTPMGTGIVRAKCVVDGTGNCDVAAAAGAETDGISAQEIARQSAGQSPHRLGRNGSNSDFAYLNDADARDLWLFSLRARAGAPEAWDLAKLPGSRERRRVVPDLRVTGEDVVARRRYPDTLVEARSRQDPHGYLTDDFGYLAEATSERIPGRGEQRDMFRVRIPLRALLPKGLSGIAVVGLGAGLAHDVQAIARMQADLMNLGYAAGLAAAMAARHEGDFRTVDREALRLALVEKGILPREAIDWKADEDISSDALIAASVETLPDGYRGGHVLYRPENRPRALPLLRAAYRNAQDDASRQTYALALGLMGDATGAETLVRVVSGEESPIQVRKGVKTVKHSAFDATGAYSSHSLTDGFLLALGRSRDRRASAALVGCLQRLGPDASLGEVRAISLALEALGDAAAAEPLAKFLRQPGMRGHAAARVSDLMPVSGYGVPPEFELAFRELSLARALLACGDFENLGRSTFEAYAKDPRGILSAHAKAVLAQAGESKAMEMEKGGGK